MTIAFLVYDISLTGGAERVAINLANEFSKNPENTIHIISVFKEKDLSTGLLEQVEVEILNNEKCSITKHLFKLSNALKQCVVGNDIEVLVSITAGVVTLAHTALKKTMTKHVYAEHSNLENRTYGCKHRFRQWVGAKYADKIVTLTERDLNNFIKQFKVRADRIIAIPNWYEGEVSDKAYSKSSKNIISVGRLEYVKGYDYLIEVAKIVLNKHKDWRWSIYGDGSERERVEEKIQENNLEDCLLLHGNVSSDKIDYSGSAFFVMTSRYEGLPLSIIEAQCAKLPVISFDCPTGPSEMVEDGVNGFLVEPYSIESLAKKIECLINSESLRVEFSRNSTNGLEKYKKTKVLRQWNTLFNQLVR